METTDIEFMIDMMHYYRHAKVSLIYPDGNVVICNEWICFSNGFFISYSGENELPNSDIEIMMDEFKGQMKLHLWDPVDVSDVLKKKYYSLCKVVNCCRKSIYMETPESITHLFKENIDAFDLINKGFAIKV